MCSSDWRMIWHAATRCGCCENAVAVDSWCNRKSAPCWLLSSGRNHSQSCECSVDGQSRHGSQGWTQANLAPLRDVCSLPQEPRPALLQLQAIAKLVNPMLTAYPNNAGAKKLLVRDSCALLRLIIPFIHALGGHGSAGQGDGSRAQRG